MIANGPRHVPWPFVISGAGRRATPHELNIMWYSHATRRVVTALRKNDLVADLHVHALEMDTGDGLVEAPPEQQRGLLQDLIASAIVKGLDVIGIISHHSFIPGQIAQQIVAQKGYDIQVYAGKEANSLEKLDVVVYQAKTPPQDGEPFTTMCQRAHNEGGFVMAIQPTRRNAQRLNKVVGTPQAPDFVEIYNEATQGGYLKAFTDADLDSKYKIVMNSAAKTTRELEDSEMMSRIPRKMLVDLGVMKEDQGIDYVPSYLQSPDIKHEPKINQPQGGAEWPVTAPPQM